MSKITTKRNINGILLLDKPLHITSNGALQRIKRLFNAKKAGHTGSLDPLATGMLPICFGEATKFSQYLLESDKQYRVKVQLGIKTTTGDAEGEAISTRPVENVTLERLTALMQKFTGPIQQIPPMFSAIKHQGKPLYELARKGIEIERAPREVQIYSLQCDGLEQDTFNMDVHCSKGTYVRTLAEDIGEELGCGAHVIGLRRISVTPYQQSKMITFEALEELFRDAGPAGLNQLLLPVESSVEALPTVKLSTSSAFYMRTGQPVMVPHMPTDGLVRLYSDEGTFLGVGEILDDGRVAPKRLVVVQNTMTKDAKPVY
jgi:tRNA pseudouridine55 synthase